MVVRKYLFFVLIHSSFVLAEQPKPLNKAALDLLLLCQKNLNSMDVQNRHLIENIVSVDASGNCSVQQKGDGELSAVEKVNMLAIKKMEKQEENEKFLDEVNDDALKSSTEAFLYFSLVRTLNPKTNKPYDLKNVNDIVELKMALCGWKASGENPSKGICDDPHRNSIIESVFAEVKKKPVSFFGESMQVGTKKEIGIYGFKVAELTNFQSQIQEFNQSCQDLKAAGKLNKPSTPTFGEKDPNNSELVRQYQKDLAVFQSGQRAVQEQMLK